MLSLNNVLTDFIFKQSLKKSSNGILKMLNDNLLSLSEVFLESVWEAFGVLDELPLALLEGLLAGDARDVSRDVVDCVQQLLDGARDVPEKKVNKEMLIPRFIRSFNYDITHIL